MMEGLAHVFLDRVQDVRCLLGKGICPFGFSMGVDQKLDVVIVLPLLHIDVTH